MKVTEVDVNIPQVELQPQEWPRLPKLELCSGTKASMNGLPFARNMDNGDTVPIGFHPPPSDRSVSSQKKAGGAASVPAGQSPQGTVTIGPPASP